MFKSKHLKIIVALIFFCIVIIIICRSSICTFFNLSLSEQSIEDIMLTKEQKVEDFEYFYSSIEDSYPMLDDEKKIMELDFLSKKTYYTDLVKNTKNNFEFFVVMSSIVSEIPSFHTDLIFPDWYSYESLNCYNLKSTLSIPNLKSKTEFWSSYISSNAEKSLNELFIFTYIDGSYIYDPLYSNQMDYFDLNDAKIISINNQSVFNFYKNRTSIMRYRYDCKRNITYKTRVILNNSNNGEKVCAKIQLSNGEIVEKSLYFDLCTEYKFIFNPVSNNICDANDQQTIYNYLDNELNLNYISIKNFSNNQGAKLKKIINETKDYSNIILDLRANTGGSNNYIKKYLYKPLFNQNISMNINWYMPKSNINQKIVKELSVFGLINSFYTVNNNEFTDNQLRNYYTTKTTLNFAGNNSTKNKNIYLLIDNYTGSAADGLSAIIKENNLATLIGINTHGEGTAGSFMISSLPNSGLVFTYMPGLSFNSDGTNNSIYGTEPNIYIEQTVDSFYKQRKLQIDEVDIFTYENRLKWDNILIDTIDIIKNNEGQ